VYTDHGVFELGGDDVVLRESYGLSRVALEERLGLHLASAAGPASPAAQVQPA
jgi:3-oxoadipate CoA-transferase beta subunit